MEDACRSQRDASFLAGIPGECMDGLLPPAVREEGWKVLKKVDFLARPQKP